MSKIKTLIKELLAEFKRINWAHWKSNGNKRGIIANFGVVLAVMLCFIAFFAVCDLASAGFIRILEGF